MMSRVALLLVCFGLFLQAQTQMNVEQLVEFLRSELAMKQSSDKQIAAEVRKLVLTEKLTDKTIIDLQAQGAGPKTTEALKEQRDKTKDLKPTGQDVTSSPATAPDTLLKRDAGAPTSTLTTKAPPIPPPDSVHQRTILDAMRDYATNYTATLPNFMCVEMTRRFADPRAQENYRSLGTILARVAYKEGQEDYKVYSVNGKLVDQSMSSVKGGAVSTGEFGSLMREIFDPKSAAEFNWDHWGTLRGRRMAVFSYFIDSGHSSWSITYGDDEKDQQRIITAYQGLVYGDPDTGEIARIKFVAVDIPKSFPVTATSETLDYDLVDISGQKYICPLTANLWMKSADGTLKNEIEFRNYRKFSSDFNIKYETDNLQPLPASKTVEQPAAAPQKPANTKPASSWDLPSAPPPPPQ
jgi:hypothetical protein